MGCAPLCHARLTLGYPPPRQRHCLDHDEDQDNANQARAPDRERPLHVAESPDLGSRHGASRANDPSIVRETPLTGGAGEGSHGTTSPSRGVALRTPGGMKDD